MVRCRNTISRPRAIGISSPRILAGSPTGWGVRDNLLGCNCHSRHPRESGDPVDAGVGVYWFPAFAGMMAVQAAKMIATWARGALHAYLLKTSLCFPASALPVQTPPALFHRRH